MATSNEKVRVIFDADAKPLTREMTKIERGMDKVNEKNKVLNAQSKKTSKQFAAGFAGAAVAVAGFALALASTVKAAIQQEQAEAQLNAVLASTKESAGLTSKELLKMASSLQLVSTFGDEAIIKSQALLLTFTKIGKETFPEAQQAIINVATAMDQDLRTTTIQLGKALNDPVANLGALSRTGIQFNEVQKDLIKGFAKSGQMAKAQAIILKELNTQFGGAALAKAKTFGGQMAILGNIFGDVKEEIGRMIINAIMPLINFLQKAFEIFQNLDPGVRSVIITIGLLGAVILVATKVVMAFGVSFTAALGPIVLLVGAVALVIDALKDTTISYEEAIGVMKGFEAATQKLVKENKKLDDSFKLVKNLKNAQKGTVVYDNALNKLSKQYPKIVEANRKAGGTYADLANNIEKAVLSAKRLALENTRKILESEAASLSKFLGRIGGDMNVTNAEILQFSKASETYFRTAKVLGLTAGQAFKQFSEKVGIDTGFIKFNLKYLGDTQKAVFGKLVSALKTTAQNTKETVDNIIKPSYQKWSGSAATTADNLNESYLKMSEDFTTHAENMAILKDDQFIFDMEIAGVRQQADIDLLVKGLGMKKTLELAHMVNMLKLRKKDKKANELLIAATNKSKEKLQATSYKAFLSGAATFFRDMSAGLAAFGALSFKQMKALNIAIAIIDGISSAISAWKAGMAVGGPLAPVFAAAFTAASVAKTAGMIAQISAQQPPAAEMGGIIPASAQGTLVRAGEKNKAEAIIPLEGIGADRLSENLGGGGSTEIHVHLEGALLAGDEIPESIAEGIDRALFKLKLNNNSVVFA